MGLEFISFFFLFIIPGIPIFYLIKLIQVNLNYYCFNIFFYIQKSLIQPVGIAGKQKSSNIWSCSWFLLWKSHVVCLLVYKNKPSIWIMSLFNGPNTHAHASNFFKKKYFQHVTLQPIQINYLNLLFVDLMS